MTQELTRERLSDLLVDPREDLHFEVKNWLDLQGSNEDKATFAKAVMALANHGGGFVALGLEEAEKGTVEALDRPPTLDGYNQDIVNGIVQNYCDPQFHCAVHIVPNPVGAVFPIVIVPGGHRVPIQARRAGPHGNIVAKHGVYIRKPGPRSETPTDAHDWNTVLEKCLRNRRDEMYDQIRGLITGEVPDAEQPTDDARLHGWITQSVERWQTLVNPLPADVGPRFPHGHYNFTYEIIGERQMVTQAQLPDLLRASVVRHTGWPPFWCPTREGIVPYPYDGVVECWLGGDPETPAQDRDAQHSDFWRIHPEGLAFLLRGFQEDSMEAQRPGRSQVPRGTIFDVVLPVWRVGETLLQAERLAGNLFEGPTTIRFHATYEGLADRSLVSMDNTRLLFDGKVARQNSISLSTHIDSQAIGPNLPEIVHPLLSPLYSLFDFFELPMQLVVEELNRLRRGNP